MSPSNRLTCGLYRVFETIFFLLFGFIIVLMVFFNRNSFYQFDMINLIICAVFGTISLGGGYLLAVRLPKISVRTEKIVVILLLVLFFALQFAIGWSVRVSTKPLWDFGVLYTFAEEFVNNGTLPDSYFSNFSGNTGNSTLYILFCMLFSFLKLFGVDDFLPYTIFINTLLINVSLLFLYFLVRRTMGVGGAMFALLLSFVTLPFIGYAPIIYTDTVSLPFAVAGALLYLKVREQLKLKNYKSALILYAFVGLICVAGYLIKPTVLILFIATVIDILIFSFGKRELFMIAISIAVIISVSSLVRLAIQNSHYLADYDDDARMPTVHLLMMGLSGDGGYNDDDLQYTLSFSTYDEKQKANIAEIERRLEEMGPLGFVDHILRKLSYTFGDGSFTVPSKLDRGAVDPNFLHKFLVPSGSYFKYTAYATFAIAVATYSFLAIGSLFALLKKDYTATFARVAIFGLVLFLMMAETRSRYLVNLLPLFIFASCYGMNNISNLLRVRKKR